MELMELFKCLEKSCKAGITVHDEGCQLTGEKCGKNMIFVVVNSIIHDGTQMMNCTQRCSCTNPDFVETISGCEMIDASGYFQSIISYDTISTGIRDFKVLFYFMPNSTSYRIIYRHLLRIRLFRQIFTSGLLSSFCLTLFMSI